MFFFYSTLASIAIIFVIYWWLIQKALIVSNNTATDGLIILNKVIALENTALLKTIPIIRGLVASINTGVQDLINDEVAGILRNSMNHLLGSLMLLMILLELGIVMLGVSIALEWQEVTGFFIIFTVIMLFMVVQTYDPIIRWAAKYQKVTRSTRPISVVYAYMSNILFAFIFFWYFFDYAFFTKVLTVFSIWVLILFAYAFMGTYFLKEVKDEGKKVRWISKYSNLAGKMMWLSMFVMIVVFILNIATNRQIVNPTEQVSKAVGNVIIKGIQKGQSLLSIGQTPGYITHKTNGYDYVNDNQGNLVWMIIKKKIHPLTRLSFTDYAKDRKQAMSSGSVVTLVGVILNGEKMYIPLSSVSLGKL